MKKILLICLISVCTNIRADDNAPYNSIVYGVKENRSMIYECNKKSDGFLHCKFSLVNIRKKVKGEEVDRLIKDEMKNFESASAGVKDDDLEFCNTAQLMLNVLLGKTEPPDKEKWEEFQNQNEKTIEDFTIQMQKLNEFCKNPTKENYKELVSFDIEKKAKTCVVSTQRYEQKFSLVQDYSTQNIVWSVVSEPYGPCGIKQLDRFERETTKIGDSDYYNWNYFAKKFISNKKGETLLGIKCSELDEEEYEYNWRQPEPQYLGCDYIEHSVF